MQRKRLSSDEEKPTEGKGNYFNKVDSKIEFIKSGCVLVDCMLGGGWPLGRMVNLVGDKSTGKTLMAIEACANFTRQYPEGLIWYREAEAAFDEGYAEALGLPVDRVDFGPEGLASNWETVEDIFEDLQKCCVQAKEAGEPGLFIIDSLDALSSRAEIGRSIDEGSYGMEKQKLLGQLFRRLTRQMKEARICLFIISQVRDAVGAMGFGPKTRRSGGRAMDFYATHIVYLTHLKQLSRTVGGIKRPDAIQVKAKCTKNKISMPFRECEFTLRFGYGIDELSAAVEFLELAKATREIDGYDKNYIKRTEQLGDSDYKKQVVLLRKAVRRVWRTVEEGFVPTRRKYA